MPPRPERHLPRDGEYAERRHGNSLRGIVKHLKNISDTDISLLNLPTAVPYVFEFDERPVLVRDYFLGDQEEIRRRTEAVAEQGMIRR